MRDWVARFVHDCSSYECSGFEHCLGGSILQFGSRYVCESESCGSAECSRAESGSKIIRMHAFVSDHADLLGNVVAVPFAFDIRDLNMVMAHKGQSLTFVRRTRGFAVDREY